MDMEVEPTLPPSRKVAYFFDEEIGAYAFNLTHPMKPHRMKMTHDLVVGYGLDKKMDVLRPHRASQHSMTAFHTDEYIDFLARVSPETVNELTGNSARFLIGTDCPAFDGLYEFCSISAGGSISSAKRLNSGQADIAINWAGGLHHAKKREASGFCYVNDIVLAILELLRFHQRVLYVDIDIHHGDGVEEAFYSTDRVMTCSFHKFGDYFPGTGDIRDRGIGKGRGYAVNFPLMDGIEDESYKSVFRPVIQHIMEWYRPGAVILQCGADSLAEDKLGCFNLSMKGHADCVSFVKSFDVPLIVVGGGGYTVRNVARAWTYETGVLAGVNLDESLPFNDHMEYYGPEFKLQVPNNNMANLNTREQLEKNKATIIDNLRHLPFCPSVQMQPLPPDPFEEEDEPDSDTDLDNRIHDRLYSSHRPQLGPHPDPFFDPSSSCMPGLSNGMTNERPKASSGGRRQAQPRNSTSAAGGGGGHDSDSDLEFPLNSALDRRRSSVTTTATTNENGAVSGRRRGGINGVGVSPSKREREREREKDREKEGERDGSRRDRERGGGGGSSQRVRRRYFRDTGRTFVNPFLLNSDPGSLMDEGEDGTAGVDAGGSVVGSDYTNGVGHGASGGVNGHGGAVHGHGANVNGFGPGHGNGNGIAATSAAINGIGHAGAYAGVAGAGLGVLDGPVVAEWR